MADLVASGDRTTLSMVTVYVIRSINRHFRYVGITDDIERRFGEHNSGRSKSTHSYAPFRLVLSESHGNRKTAREREKFLKSGAGRKFLDKIESGS